MNFPGGPADPKPVVHFPNLPFPYSLMTPQQLSQMYPISSAGFPPVPAIQPDLEPARQIQQVEVRTEQVAKTLKVRKSRLREESGKEASEGSDADNEGDNEEPPAKKVRRSRGAKKVTSEKILSLAVGSLKMKQRDVWKELQVCNTHLV